MKFAILLFLLMPFAVNASDDLCVENNVDKCKELGYTETSCSYGGVACVYNPSLWHCAKWTCADGRLYTAENKPTDAECVETAYKDLTCYDCKVPESPTLPYDASKTVVATFEGGGTITVYNNLPKTSRMWVDGVEVTPQKTIEFSTGTHEVAMDGLTAISAKMFQNVSNLTAITIPETVTAIGSYAFGNCVSLEEITIPQSVTAIESYAFYKCTSLTKITIPQSVTQIGNYAFYNAGILTLTYLGKTTPTCSSASVKSVPTIIVPADYESDLFCYKSFTKQ